MNMHCFWNNIKRIQQSSFQKNDIVAKTTIILKAWNNPLRVYMQVVYLVLLIYLSLSLLICHLDSHLVHKVVERMKEGKVCKSGWHRDRQIDSRATYTESASGWQVNDLDSTQGLIDWKIHQIIPFPQRNLFSKHKRGRLQHGVW